MFIQGLNDDGVASTRFFSRYGCYTSACLSCCDVLSSDSCSPFSLSSWTTLLHEQNARCTTEHAYSGRRTAAVWCLAPELSWTRQPRAVPNLGNCSLLHQRDGVVGARFTGVWVYVYGGMGDPTASWPLA